MDINSSFNIGKQALQQADAGLRRNAETVAKISARVSGSEDVNTALVQAKENQQQARVAVEVVRAADETVGTLLDVNA